MACPAGFLKHYRVFHPPPLRLLDDSTLKEHKHDITGTGMDTSFVGWAPKAVIRSRGPGISPDYYESGLRLLS